MATLAKRPKNYRGSRELIRSSSSQVFDYEAVNLEALNGVISYLKSLYAKGRISDKAYQTLVAQVLSTFVENSVHSKVEQIFDKVDFALKEVNEVILSNII